jgi:ascorbate-specific PTS system EIIC-type component UlaA
VLSGRIKKLLTLCLVSLFTIAFVAAWGPGSIYIVQLPASTSTSDIIISIFWNALIFSPLIYLIVLAVRRR